MADPTVKQIFEETIPARLQASPGLGKEIDALIHFRINGPGGGDFTLDCTGDEPKISEGLAGTPRLTVSCADSDFVQISTRRLNANMAAMSGKLKLSPMDMGLALKLAKLLA